LPLIDLIIAIRGEARRGRHGQGLLADIVAVGIVALQDFHRRRIRRAVEQCGDHRLRRAEHHNFAADGRIGRRRCDDRPDQRHHIFGERLVERAELGRLLQCSQV
jgi:hypothetical protein